ncbi:hypothetical protein TNCT_197821 [Trichonephila clavata]|uniref:Uncharacterized protein n=1 Tax=Trichonephila clavata TaxID=2740835 RepID=A0A8X6M5W8_TRICU|nr:hypothetical protein TNCT_197821 [Trichonephila clavata]
MGSSYCKSVLGIYPPSLKIVFNLGATNWASHPIWSNKRCSKAPFLIHFQDDGMDIARCCNGIHTDLLQTRSSIEIHIMRHTHKICLRVISTEQKQFPWVICSRYYNEYMRLQHNNLRLKGNWKTL